MKKITLIFLFALSVNLLAQQDLFEMKGGAAANGEVMIVKILLPSAGFSFVGMDKERFDVGYFDSLYAANFIVGYMILDSAQVTRLFSDQIILTDRGKVFVNDIYPTPGYNKIGQKGEGFEEGHFNYLYFNRINEVFPYLLTLKDFNSLDKNLHDDWQYVSQKRGHNNSEFVYYNERGNIYPDSIYSADDWGPYNWNSVQLSYDFLVNYIPDVTTTNFLTFDYQTIWDATESGDDRYQGAVTVQIYQDSTIIYENTYLSTNNNYNSVSITYANVSGLVVSSTSPCSVVLTMTAKRQRFAKIKNFIVRK